MIEDEAIRKKIGECLLLEGYEKSDTVEKWIFQWVDVDAESIRCERK